MTHRWQSRKTNVLRLAATTFALIAFPGSATTIVAIWTPDRIILAADTALSSADGKQRIGTVCKLKKESTIWFATAGLFEFPLTGFDMPDIIHRRYERRPVQDIGFLGAMFSSDIEFALDNARKSVDETLRINPNLNVSENIIVGPDRGVEGVLYHMSNIYGSTARDTGGGGKEMHSTGARLLLPTGMPYRAEIAVAGEKDAIFEYQLENPIWQATDPVALARLFLDLEIARHPITVGRPIAILSVGIDGRHQWEEKPDVCKDED